MIVFAAACEITASTSDLFDCVNFRPARARLRRIRSVSFQDGVLEAATRGSNQSSIDEFTPQMILGLKKPGPIYNCLGSKFVGQLFPWLKLPDTGCSSKMSKGVEQVADLLIFTADVRGQRERAPLMAIAQVTGVNGRCSVATSKLRDSRVPVGVAHGWLMGRTGLSWEATC
jgi:hypothetical protein